MIHPTAVIDPSATVRVDRLNLARGATIGPDVVIEGEELVLGDRAEIGPRCRISSRSVSVGWRSRLERDITVGAIGGMADEFRVGDASFLGFGIVFALPAFAAGDYVTIHNSTLINGYEPCVLGHNCWVGQQSILNSTARLTIGNNVRISTQCQVWTHVASGEVLEGCTLYGADPVTLEDDVWLMSGSIVSPRLHLKRRAVVATGAVMTQDGESEHLYGGVPAVDITDKIRPYRQVTIADKVVLMRGFLEEFHAATGQRFLSQVHLVDPVEPVEPELDEREHVVIVGDGQIRERGTQVTVLDLATKTYLKRRTSLEHDFLRFHVGHRARFIPAAEDQP